MTLSSTANRISYAGNGSTKAFAFPYRFLANSDLVVIETVDATGVQTTKTLTSDYTVSGAGDSGGGTVTMVTAPASGVTLTIYRDVPLTQTLNLIENSIQSAEELEAAHDRRAMVDQRLKEMITRALRQPEGDSADIGRLPAKADRASKFMAFDADGNPTAAASVTGAAVSAFMETLLDDANAAAARATLGITGTTVDIFAADYGATGDGSTDDTSALQDAIDACVAGQRLRLTPNKTYITTGLTLDNAGMVLDLNGATIKLMDSALANAKAVSITADDVWIVGPGTIDGNRANQTVGSTESVYVEALNRWRISGVHITGSEGYGIHVEEPTAGTISDALIIGCRLTDCAGAAIKVVANAGNVSRVVAQDCYIDQTGTTAGAISFAENASATIDDCAIINCRALCATTANVDVIHFWGSGTRNRVIGCYAQGGDIGISIANGQSHALVVGCTTYNNDTHGIEIVDSTHCAVVGCVVDGNANTGIGISVDGTNTDAEFTSVAGNTVRRVTTIGISFYSGTPYSVANGNAVDVADAAADGIYLNVCPDVALNGNVIDGSGTANTGIVAVRSSRVSMTGNNISNFANHAVQVSQDAAGTLDYVSITGGVIYNNANPFQFSASGGGALGANCTHNNVVGWATGAFSGNVLDWNNFRGTFWGTGDPEGSLTAGIGSTYLRLGGSLGAQEYVKESGTGNTGWRARQSRTIVEVTVTAAELAGAASKTLVAAITGARFKLRDAFLSGAGTNFSGGGGDRNIAIQDASGTTIWSVIPAATAQSLAFNRWGDTGLPEPGTASHFTAQSVAGEALVAKYSGGTADYGAGSLTLVLEIERTT